MCLIARFRALVTALVLASYSPFGTALLPAESGSGHAGHLAVSMFIGRRTRVAASQQFDVAHRVVVLVPRTRSASTQARCAFGVRLQTKCSRMTSGL